MEHWELVARESARDLVARYNANGDAGRVDEVLDLFAADAIVEVSFRGAGSRATPDRRYEGRDDIRSLFEAAGTEGRAGGGITHLRHFTSSHQIDVASPEAAAGRCYYAVITDQGLDHWGRYIDAYRFIDGRWHFAHRRVTLDGLVKGGWAERSQLRLRAGSSD